MFAARASATFDRRGIERAAQKAKYQNFRHAAASISRDAKASLVKAEVPSDPGEPPHTHQGAFLRRAIRYAADGEGAVIGPQASVVGEVGAAHEFGGKFRDETFAARPFMQPALARAAPRFADRWRGSIGQ